MRGVLAGMIWALCASVILAQDLTLTSRDGSLAVQGVLRAYDGEVYRIDTDYGLLTIDAAAVICDGPACPDLTAPRAVIRFAGDAEAGDALLAPLIQAFAAGRGMGAQRGDDGITRLRNGAGTVLAEITFAPMTPEDARLAQAEARADLLIARFAPAGVPARVLALDALIPIISPDNPTPRISTTDLARALAGEIDNWAQIGGPDRPMVLHGPAAGSDLAAALSARLGKPTAIKIAHPDLTQLAAGVAADPWALALTGRAQAGAARALTLTDSCGFALPATPLAVKAEDYPLTLPVYLLTPPRRLPLMAREFLDFLALPAAQLAISAAGYVSQEPERLALASDGMRLINAIDRAGDEIGLDDLKRLSVAMAGAQRLSLTFRFQDGSDALDARSTQNLGVLANGIESGLFDRDLITLVGFSDGTGGAVRNQELALARAKSVQASLAALGTLPLPAVDAFGESMPMACDDTAAGRRLNRRVEVWLRPKLD